MFFTLATGGVGDRQLLS